jgi:hypothetical protein
LKEGSRKTINHKRRLEAHFIGVKISLRIPLDSVMGLELF